MMFLDCPAWLDKEGAARCGLPAEVRCRYTLRSTDGLLESAMIRCPDGHWFNGPIESLTWEGKHVAHDQGTARAATGVRPDSLKRSHDGPSGTGRHISSRDCPWEPDRETCRPNGAPAYYLGRPACLWITAMRRRRMLAVHG
jgi:hypothetical protein